MSESATTDHPTPVSEARAREVFAQHGPTLLENPTICAVGVIATRRGWVMTARASSRAGLATLPAHLDGVPLVASLHGDRVNSYDA